MGETNYSLYYFVTNIVSLVCADIGNRMTLVTDIRKKPLSQS